MFSPSARDLIHQRANTVAPTASKAFLWDHWNSPVMRRWSDDLCTFFHEPERRKCVTSAMSLSLTRELTNCRKKETYSARSCSKLGPEFSHRIFPTVLKRVGFHCLCLFPRIQTFHGVLHYRYTASRWLPLLAFSNQLARTAVRFVWMYLKRAITGHDVSYRSLQIYAPRKRWRAHHHRSVFGFGRMDA